ncbi:MAG: ribonuclease R [Bacteroidetes bacterium CG2_30_32_10]|nr:MAG: ribonuclease R [Bacteroidetes bacterium CG2_30_32_10]
MKKNKIKKHFQKEILEIFDKNASQLFNYKQLAKIFNVKDDDTRRKINAALIELCAQKELIEDNKGKYKRNLTKSSKRTDNKPYITGIVDMKSTGKAYVISDESAEDIMVQSNNTNRALNGDKVKVYLLPKRKDKKLEGEIIEVIERGKSTYVGIIQLSGKFAFLVPDNLSMPVDIFIPLENLNGAKDGQKVIAEISEWPERARNPFGKVIHILGTPGDNNVEMNSILAEYMFPLSFSKEAETEANRFPSEIPPHEIKNRRDFREVFTMTIDPADAKDFDDALSLLKLPNGNWEVGVHIADVSYFVTPGTILDKEALERGTSVYLVDRTIPMLPEHLSNGVCSLKQDEEKLCFSAVFEMDENATILNEWFGKTVIKSNRRFAYGEVQEVIEARKGEYASEILTLYDLSYKLRQERYKKGSIDFEREEVKFKLDEKGKPLSVYFVQQKEANKLIEDFMLLANRKVAELIGKKKENQAPKPFVYRVHDQPNPEKLQNFSEFVGKLGYKLKIASRKNVADSMNKLLKDITGKGEENMIETLAIRTMAKAIYTTENIGHYGLAFDFYTHFTSPIRRYPDLMVHRLLDYYLKGGKPIKDVDAYEDMCKHASDMEKKAADAERASTKYKQVEFLIDKVGQIFDGLISGVSKWGIFVEIVENKCEGMVRLKDIDDDFYYLDEENYCVIGQRYGNTYRLGDKVKIKIKKADLSKKQLDYIIVK